MAQASRENGCPGIYGGKGPAAKSACHEYCPSPGQGTEAATNREGKAHPGGSICLLLLRHSLTMGNERRLYIGDTDEPLSEKGRALALETLPLLPKYISAVYCSPLLRCRQTAELLFPGLSAVTVDSLRESSFGEFEGKGYGQLKDDPRYTEWIEGGGALPPPGGELPELFERRCEEALQYILTDMESRDIQRAAAVTHGGVVMRIMRRLFGGGLYDWQPPCCGGYILRMGEGAPRFERLPFRQNML